MGKAFRGLAFGLLAVVGVQFFLAGSGAFDPAPNDESFQAHRALGYGTALYAVLLTVVAAAARLPGRVVGLTGLVAGLSVGQGLIAVLAKAFGDTGGSYVFGLHAINGLVILAVIREIVRRAGERSTSTVVPDPVS